MSNLGIGYQDDFSVLEVGQILIKGVSFLVSQKHSKWRSRTSLCAGC
jgi:hypothetical protein